MIKIFIKKHFITLIVFILITLFFTYPVIFKMNTAVYGPLYGTDSRGTIWQLWWARYSYAHNLDFYVHSILAAPYGNDMSHSPEGLLWQVLTRWLPIITNEIFTYNIVLILSFILSCFFMYLIVFFITQDRLASFLSGIIFGFCPYHFQRAWEHFSLAQIQWIALYFYALLRLHKDFSWKNIILFITSATFVIHLEFNYTYIIAILSFLFLIFILFNNKKQNIVLSLRFIVKFIFASLLCLLVNSHLIWAIVKSLFIAPAASADTVDMGYRPFHYLFSQSARILSYLVPSSANPVLGGLAKALEGSIFYGRGPIEQTLYLGLVPIILSWIAWKRSKSVMNSGSIYTNNFYVKLCVFVALGGFLFSMPPYFDLGFMKIYFPSFLMYKILPMFRAYARFGILVIMSVSILSGIGLKYFLENIKVFRKKLVLCSLALIIIFFEFNNLPPFRATDISNPPVFYKWLAEQKGDFIIANYPLEEASPGEAYIELDHLFYQRVHQKKIINGALPGTYGYKIKELIKKITDPQTPGILKWLGTKYVIVFLEKYKSIENTQAMDILGDLPDLTKQSGLKLIKKFDDIEVYEVIATSIKPKI